MKNPICNVSTYSINCVLRSGAISLAALSEMKRDSRNEKLKL